MFRPDRRWAIASGVMVVGLIASVRWYRRPADPRYVTAEVTRGPIVRAITTTGAVDPVITVLVGAYVSGTIQSTSCDYKHPGEGAPAVRQDRPAPLSGRRRSGHRQPGNRSVAAPEGPSQPRLREDQLRARLEARPARCRIAGRRRQRQERLRSGRGAGELDEATIEQRQAELHAAQVN